MILHRGWVEHQLLNNLERTGAGNSQAGGVILCFGDAMPGGKDKAWII